MLLRHGNMLKPIPSQQVEPDCCLECYRTLTFLDGAISAAKQATREMSAQSLLLVTIKPTANSREERVCPHRLSTKRIAGPTTPPGSSRIKMKQAICGLRDEGTTTARLTN